MRRVAALLAFALVAGCGTREHANPFDPQNPITGGRPAGFLALAGPQRVDLRWTRPTLAGDFGYRLFRRIAGEADFRQIGSDLSGTTTGYLDSVLANGTLHEYRLYYVFSGATGGLPAEDVATPGTLRPWCADRLRRTLIGATPDGRHVVSETGDFFGPTHVAVDPTSGKVWISDTYDGRVVIFDPWTGGRFGIRGPAEPVAIALDPIDRSAWVCDQGRDVVYHYSESGVPGTPAQLPGEILTPIGVACDPVSGAVWVCERGAHQVGRYSRAGTLLGKTPLQAPSRVAVDSATGDAWVTSFEGARVVRFSPAGAAADTVALSGPIGIAVDARRGRIWVADARAARIVALRTGGIEFQVGGLPEAREVAVDLATGDAWVTVPGLRMLVRISGSGAVLERLGGFSDPYGIALDPGRPRSP